MNSIFKITIICLTTLVAVESVWISRAMQNFPKACLDLLQAQIQTEMNAAQVYLSLSSYFHHDAVALHGFHRYFEESYEDELKHADKIIDYIIKRGGVPKHPSIAAPANDSTWDSNNVCQIINIAIGMEMQVNTALIAIANCADSNKDPHLEDFIEDEFLDEQVDDIKEKADLLTKLERATKYVNSAGSLVSACDGLGVHVIDRELDDLFDEDNEIYKGLREKNPVVL